MIVVRHPKHYKVRIALRPKREEFAPVLPHPTIEERTQLFADLKRWGMASVDVGRALGVPEDRVRGWRVRTQFHIPLEYWDALKRLHAAGLAMMQAMEAERAAGAADALLRKGDDA